MMYTEVDSRGYVVRSAFTTNPDEQISEGNRLLPDNRPIANIDYIPGLTRPVRVEPVPIDSTEIVYIIVKEHENDELTYKAIVL